MTPDELRAVIAADERHWWYRGRRRVLRAVLDRLALRRHARILDAGCGSGVTLDLLAGYGTVVGIDMDPMAVAATRARGHPVLRARVEALPFGDGTFDLITCLDVMEHTPDDRRTLRELRRVLHPSGVLLVTVPAYPALWSAHDVANLHHRRYTRRALRAAAAETGWAPAMMTSFNAALLGPAAAVRLARRHRRPAASELTLTPAAVDRLLEQPLRLEAAAIRAGARLPFGLSLLAVLREAGIRPEPVALRSPPWPAPRRRSAGSRAVPPRPAVAAARPSSAARGARCS